MVNNAQVKFSCCTAVTAVTENSKQVSKWICSCYWQQAWVGAICGGLGDTVMFRAILTENIIVNGVLSMQYGSNTTWGPWVLSACGICPVIYINRANTTAKSPLTSHRLWDINYIYTVIRTYVHTYSTKWMLHTYWLYYRLLYICKRQYGMAYIRYVLCVCVRLW